MYSNPTHVARTMLATSLRILVLSSATAILAGCYTAQEALVDSIPNDYRHRHPVVLKEAPRSVELFIGNRRSTLTGSQRAEVLAFAQAWRGEATGGVMIDVPAGTPNERSAAGALQEHFDSRRSTKLASMRRRRRQQTQVVGAGRAGRGAP